MNKKIIAGSIGAITVIILASFTSAVGYQSIQPSIEKNTTPLYQIRTQKATNQQQTTTSNYLGKENQHNIPLPQQNNKAAHLQKILTRLSTIPQEKLFTLISNQHINNDKIPQLMKALQQLRDNPNAFKQYVTTLVDQDSKSPLVPTFGSWFCLFILFLMSIIGEMFRGIFDVITTMLTMC